MRKSIILYTLLCAVSSGVSVAHAAVYDQVTQEYASRYDISLSNEYQAMDVVKGRFAWQDGYTLAEPT